MSPSPYCLLALYLTLVPSDSVCVPDLVPKSNSLLSYIPRTPEASSIGYFNRAVYSVITKHLRGYSP